MKNHVIGALAAVCGSLAVSTAGAASISLQPSFQAALPGDTVELDLVMDFTGEPTIGGGIDIFLSGPLSFQGFTPSDYFLAADPFFSGYGTENAGVDAALEVHIGNFAGLSGAHELGTLSILLTGAGLGQITLGMNEFWGGGFFDTAGNLDPMSVDLFGAEVNAVPLPATAWMLLTGVGALVARRMRRSGAAA